jgi:hypothetical protein
MPTTTKKTHPWKRRYQLPDRSVHEAAGQIEEGSQVQWKAVTPGTGALLPFLNVAAVTIELYLKSVSSSLNFVPQDDGGDIVYSAPNKHGHEPSKLLKAVEPALRDQLEAAHSEWPGNEGQNLADRCATYDRLFSGSRYVFEQNQNIGGLRLERLLDLIAFLKHFVDNLSPAEWIEWHEPATTQTK